MKKYLSKIFKLGNKIMSEIPTVKLDTNLMIDMLSLTELIYYNQNPTGAKGYQLLEYNNRLLDDKLFEFIENRYDLQAGVTISDKQHRIVVVFRGSDSLKDFVQDVKINKVSLGDNVRVHDGFYQQLMGNYDQLESIVKKLLQDNPTYQLYVTGHSLGGALATLYGYMLSNKIDQYITIMTFGSPRVGNYKFMDSFMKKPNIVHYRITNGRDVITALPIVNYYHTGYHIILDNHRINIQNDKNCVIKWYRSSILYNWRIDDHLLMNYFKNII